MTAESGSCCSYKFLTHPHLKQSLCLSGEARPRRDPGMSPAVRAGAGRGECGRTLVAAGARSPVGVLHGRQAELLAALASLAAL